MIYQQLLPIDKLRGKMTFENFYEGSNHLLVNQIKKAVTSSESDKLFYLSGEEYSGKTHLAFSIIDEALKFKKRVYYLDGKNLPKENFKYSDFQDSLNFIDIFIIDHLEMVVPSCAWETFLFNIFNYFKAENKFFLVISKTEKLKFDLVDFHSRLQSCWHLILNHLKDNEKCEVLKKIALRYGLKVQEDAFSFLLHRFSRNMGELIKALEELDKLTLQIQKPLTIPLIRKWLKSLEFNRKI